MHGIDANYNDETSAECLGKTLVKKRWGRGLRFIRGRSRTTFFNINVRHSLRVVVEQVAQAMNEKLEVLNKREGWLACGREGSSTETLYWWRCSSRQCKQKSTHLESSYVTLKYVKLIKFYTYEGSKRRSSLTSIELIKSHAYAAYYRSELAKTWQ